MEVGPGGLRDRRYPGRRRPARPDDRGHARDAAGQRAGTSRPTASCVAFVGARHRLRGEQGPLRHLARRRRRLDVAPDDDAPRQRHRPAVVARRQVDLLRCRRARARAQVWRIAAAGGEAEQVTKLADRRQRLRAVPRRQAPGRSRSTSTPTRRRSPTPRSATRRRRSPRSRRASTTSCCSATGISGRTASSRTCSSWDAGEARRRARSDARPRRPTRRRTRSAAWRRSTSRPTASTVAFVARASAAARTRGRRTPTCSSSRPTAGSKPVDLTAENKAYDFEPAFSPDGKSLALTLR